MRKPATAVPARITGRLTETSAITPIAPRQLTITATTPRLEQSLPQAARALTSASSPDAEKQRRAELADREQRTYNAAQGNLSALRAYVTPT